MTVRIGDVTFSDWTSLEYPDGWTDTFIFRIDAHACIPPFNYAPLIRRLVAHVIRKRSCASIWVQVDSPGEWFVIEVRKSLRGLRLPFAVTLTGIMPDILDFSYKPRMFETPLLKPPAFDGNMPPVSTNELRCLQALARMDQGLDNEISSLTGLTLEATTKSLKGIAGRKFLTHEMRRKIPPVKLKPKQISCLPYWYLKRRGLDLALRSWGAPRGIFFGKRKEAHLWQLGTSHRHISRLWPDWLKSALPQAEIWTGWSEVRIPDSRVVPDGLAWGRIQGYETLFWLEVGDGHKSIDEIIKTTRKRLVHARRLCQRTGARLVYTQLSTGWVHNAVRWACMDLTENESVVMGNLRRFGVLPMIEWGTISFELR
ncbi:MAG TPA: hypothetical protein VLA72_09380 [Anaerolineales bacterium]|nr:hypothetical protein [Anaerolineales bacterium]